jgi:hypothetical protein
MGATHALRLRSELDGIPFLDWLADRKPYLLPTPTGTPQLHPAYNRAAMAAASFLLNASPYFPTARFDPLTHFWFDGIVFVGGAGAVKPVPTLSGP